MSDMEITGLARRLAEDNDVDWRQLTGTGEGGRITEQDVIDHLAREMQRSTPGEAGFQSEPAAGPVAPDFDESIFALDEEEDDVAPEPADEAPAAAPASGATQEGQSPSIADAWNDGGSDWLSTGEEGASDEFDWLDAELSVPEPPEPHTASPQAMREPAAEDPEPETTEPESPETVYPEMETDDQEPPEPVEDAPQVAFFGSWDDEDQDEEEPVNPAISHDYWAQEEEDAEPEGGLGQFGSPAQEQAATQEPDDELSQESELLSVFSGESPAEIEAHAEAEPDDDDDPFGLAGESGSERPAFEDFLFDVDDDATEYEEEQASAAEDEASTAAGVFAAASAALGRELDEESEEWLNEPQPWAREPEPWPSFGPLLKGFSRWIRVGRLDAAAEQVADELDSDPATAREALLLAAAAKAWREAAEESGDGEVVLLHTASGDLTGAGSLPLADYLGLNDILHELENGTTGEQQGTTLAILDLEEVDLDEVELEAPFPVIVVGRSQGYGRRSQARLSLTGEPLPARQGAHLLVAIARLLESPLRILL